MIAAAGPRGAVGRGEQGVDFDIGQEGHEPARAAFGRNREYAGNDGRLLGMLQRGVAEQSVNGRQPCVAGAHGVRTILFEVRQEPPDERRVEVADFELRGRFGEVSRREAE